MKVGTHTYARSSPPVAPLFTPGAIGFSQAQLQATFPQQPLFERQENFGAGGDFLLRECARARCQYLQRIHL